MVFCGVFIAGFFELVTPAFIDEYGLRPNRLFIEYLIYPNEVASMLVNGHLFTLISVLLLLGILGVVGWFLMGRFVANHPQVSVKMGSSSLACLAMVLVVFACARGTTGHRPLNPSLVYFSTDPLLNSLTLNSVYSVAFALKQMGNEKNAAHMYGELPQSKVIDLVRAGTGLPSERFTNNDIPTLVKRTPVYTGQPKNLVIILEESIGAQYVGALGGLPLTPKLDALMDEGWAFEQLYATGTRSVRGIEAVVSGFTPTPARAVVKLDKSQTNFFTIASLLKQQNYQTQFIYGGESHFDNMKSFFLGNGFTDIVDFDDIESPQFVASWGASNEDLFNQADRELQALNQNNRPFFSLIFSSSNHDPFEIPETDIAPLNYAEFEDVKSGSTGFSEKELLRHKAIQYADYSVGEFIKKAKTKDYWENTVFLIVADHDARVFGADLVPIHHFHIPAVILNGGINRKVDARIVSQIDLAPTLLSLMGIENETPMLGHDLTNNNVPQRALMQYSDNFAFMKNNDVVILQPNKAPASFVYDANNKRIKPSKQPHVFYEEALAHALWGSLAYKNGWYRLKEG